MSITKGSLSGHTELGSDLDGGVKGNRVVSKTNQQTNYSVTLRNEQWPWIVVNNNNKIKIRSKFPVFTERMTVSLSTNKPKVSREAWSGRISLFLSLNPAHTVQLLIWISYICGFLVGDVGSEGRWLTWERNERSPNENGCHFHCLLPMVGTIVFLLSRTFLYP
jgi:hypothetical protein